MGATGQAGARGRLWGSRVVPKGARLGKQPRSTLWPWELWEWSRGGRDVGCVSADACLGPPGGQHVTRLLADLNLGKVGSPSAGGTEDDPDVLLW